MQVLKPVLEATRKQIFITADVSDKIMQQRSEEPYKSVYEAHLQIQRHIVTNHNYENIGTLLNSNTPALVIIGHSKIGNLIARYKQHKALQLTKEGISVFAQKTKSQTHRSDITPISYGPTPFTGHLPQVGDTVNFTLNGQKQSITLTSEFARGGEGIIYTTPTSYIAKIYQDSNNNETSLKIPSYTYPKLKKLAKVKLKDSYQKYIFLPHCLLYNEQNCFVGYLMDQATGKPIQSILTVKDQKKHFPNCSRKDLATICINFLQCVIELHAKNILIGDINTHNILFDTQCNVYLIDCDSYQIDKFPCPVANPDFLYPELRGKDMKHTMRSLADEYYAIAIFLFMIIHLGQHPYDSKGNTTRDQAMHKMQFPYAINASTPHTPPLGQKGWEALNQPLREHFYHTFQKNGQYSTPDRFISPQKWLELFKQYAQQL